MLVSIYMPTKNRADLVQRAAASVLNQTHRQIELLIVDDGSTDETPRVLDTLKEQDARVRVFRNEASKGAPFSRNLAISNAGGEWITGIDDDDTFHPRRISSLIDYWQLLAAANVPFSCLYTQDIYDDGATQEISSKRGTVTWTDMLEFNVVGNQIFTLTDRIKASGMFDVEMPAWQDLDLFIRVLKQFGPAKLLDAALYTLNIDERLDRISRSKKAKILTAFERVSAKHPDIDDRLRQALFLQVFVKLYKHQPDLRDALRFFSFGWYYPNARRFLSHLLKRA